MPASQLTRDVIAAVVRAALGSSAPPGAIDGAAVIAAYLFGSCARGTPQSDSDVDLGLLYRAPPASTLLAQPFLLEAQLSEQLACPVQCVVTNSAPVDLVHRILMDRALLMESSPSHRIRFEINARSRYFDLKPVLDHYRRHPESSVTDHDLLADKLAFVESCVTDLRQLPVIEHIGSDLKERRFVEHTLQLAIQACLDAASHVVSNDRLGEPSSLPQLFQLLEQAGRISGASSAQMQTAAELRTLLVYGYTEMDINVTRGLLEQHLDGLLAFVAAIRSSKG